MLNTILYQIKNVQLQNVEGLQDDSTERTDTRGKPDGFTNEIGSIPLDGVERETNFDSIYQHSKTKNSMSSQSG